MADLSKIKLNGVEYDLKDVIAREAIENIPQMDENKINKAWSIIEADSGETTIIDMVPQQTIDLTGNPEADLVNNVNIPEEETECTVSFDLYEEQTLITSVSKNITIPYGKNNNPSSFAFDNENYGYDLFEVKKGFGITIFDITNKIELGSPYRVVNFHIYREIPIMIPTMGWNSEAVPIPTKNDIGKDLKVGYEISNNQILTHGQNSVYISQPTVMVSTDSIFSNNSIVPDGIYTTILNSSKYTNLEIELTPHYYNSNDGERHCYLESKFDDSGSYSYYFTIYENGNVLYGPHRHIFLNEDISFTDIIGSIKKPVLNWAKDDNILKVIFTNDLTNNILSCNTQSEDIYQAFLDKKIIMGIYENEIYYISNITSANNISFISDNDTAKIKKKLYYTSSNGWSYQEIDMPTPDLTNFMVKGTDYVTAGQKSGTILGTKSTAEGENTIASADCSHAEGGNTTASATDSHAEGNYTTASGFSSHAEGNYTIASGFSSHAEGYYTITSGDYSHAEGIYTTAQRKSQHVFGEYNILDTTGTMTTRGQYVEIVGKGTSNNNRSNARTLDWSGNEVLAGKLTIGAAPTDNMDVTTKQYVDSAITTAIGNVNSFGVQIVSGKLPTQNIDTHTIYFKSNSSSGNNIYDEFMYINNNWEIIGSTQIDLTPYALSANLATVATSGDYDDLTDAPTAETDANVEDMLDSFNLDYTSNTTSPNYANGVSF